MLQLPQPLFQRPPPGMAGIHRGLSPQAVRQPGLLTAAGQRARRAKSVGDLIGPPEAAPHRHQGG